MVTITTSSMVAHMNSSKMKPLARFLNSSFDGCTLFHRIGLCRRYGASSSESHEIAVVMPNSRPLIVSTGKLAKFADGCAVVRLGDTSVMAVAVGKSKALNSGFVPLTVDYRQKAAAAGRIPTNHLRREMGPTEKEILTSRMIDRSLRPLFPQGYCYETQITCNLLAVDGVNDPDVISINAASAALCISDIPWNGPVAAVRVGLVDGQIVFNPTRKESTESTLNLVVTAGDHNTVVMLEGNGERVHEQDMLKAIKDGVKEATTILSAFSEIQQLYGKPKRKVSLHVPSNILISAAQSICETRLQDVFSNYSHDKISRDNELSAIRQQAIEALKKDFENADSEGLLISEAVNCVVKQVFREQIFTTGKRCDGRDLTSLRDISCAVNLYPPLHGSALFQRGQTQVLCTVAFDSLDSVFRSNPISIITGGIKDKNFMLHYEFPPYATNETGRAGGIMNRRELGHGALAEKGLLPIVPSDYPFTIRLTSEVLESNGSSSMASVCGGSMALMDAGVPVKASVAGVAIGLVSKSEGDDQITDYRVLADILGIEDYFGDMDFKIAGTRKGLTALQLDVKLPGIPLKVVTEAILQSRVSQKEILAIMDDTIDTARSEKKSNWPVSEMLDIPEYRRAKFIGIGGMNLKKLTAETGVQVSPINENKFGLFAPNKAAMDEAKEMIDDFLAEKEPVLDFGAIYSAKIVEIKDNGVMVTLFPKMAPVFLHLSQLDQRKVGHPSVIGIQVGQEISVKYFGRDPVSGFIRLSRKVLQGLPSPVTKNLSERLLARSSNNYSK